MGGSGLNTSLGRRVRQPARKTTGRGWAHPTIFARGNNATTLAKKRAGSRRHKVLTVCWPCSCSCLLMSRPGRGNGSSATVALSSDAATGTQTAAAPAAQRRLRPPPTRPPPTRPPPTRPPPTRPPPTRPPPTRPPRTRPPRTRPPPTRPPPTRPPPTRPPPTRPPPTRPPPGPSVSRTRSKWRRITSEFTAFSLSGLIDQVEFEGFSTVDAARALKAEG